MTVRTTHNGDVTIAFETVGPPTDEPLLLITGTGAQMLTWHQDFCTALIEHGFQVARYDNRDAGLSTRFDGAGRPNQLLMWLRPSAAAAYRIEDMADDAVAVLDANGWGSAHLLGVSQGGMIAQTVALRHPDRVRSLTSISSAPAPRIGAPRLRTLGRIASVVRRPVTDAESSARQAVELAEVVGSPAYPTDTGWLLEVARRSYERGYDLAAVQRHTAAIAASGDRRAQLGGIRVPTLVVHGDADPLIRPVGGEQTARAIPGAEYLVLPGMGHDLPRELWPAITDAVGALAGRAGQPESRAARCSE